MAISLKNHEDRITALENRRECVVQNLTAPDGIIWVTIRIGNYIMMWCNIEHNGSGSFNIKLPVKIDFHIDGSGQTITNTTSNIQVTTDTSYFVTPRVNAPTYDNFNVEYNRNVVRCYYFVAGIIKS